MFAGQNRKKAYNMSSALKVEMDTISLDIVDWYLPDDSNDTPAYGRGALNIE